MYWNTNRNKEDFNVKSGRSWLLSFYILILLQILQVTCPVTSSLWWVKKMCWFSICPTPFLAVNMVWWLPSSLLVRAENRSATPSRWGTFFSRTARVRDWLTFLVLVWKCSHLSSLLNDHLSECSSSVTLSILEDIFCCLLTSNDVEYVSRQSESYTFSLVALYFFFFFFCLWSSSVSLEFCLEVHFLLSS